MIINLKTKIEEENCRMTNGNVEEKGEKMEERK